MKYCPSSWNPADDAPEPFVPGQLLYYLPKGEQPTEENGGVEVEVVEVVEDPDEPPAWWSEGDPESLVLIRLPEGNTLVVDESQLNPDPWNFGILEGMELAAHAAAADAYWAEVAARPPAEEEWEE